MLYEILQCYRMLADARGCYLLDDTEQLSDATRVVSSYPAKAEALLQCASQIVDEADESRRPAKAETAFAGATDGAKDYRQVMPEQRVLRSVAISTHFGDAR